MVLKSNLLVAESMKIPVILSRPATPLRKSEGFISAKG